MITKTLDICPICRNANIVFDHLDVNKLEAFYNCNGCESQFKAIYDLKSINIVVPPSEGFKDYEPWYKHAEKKNYKSLDELNSPLLEALSYIFSRLSCEEWAEKVMNQGGSFDFKDFNIWFCAFFVEDDYDREKFQEVIDNDSDKSEFYTEFWSRLPKDCQNLGLDDLYLEFQKEMIRTNLGTVKVVTLEEFCEMCDDYDYLREKAEEIYNKTRI